MNRCVLLEEGKIDNQEIETYGWGVGRVRKRQEIDSGIYQGIFLLSSFYNKQVFRYLTFHYQL